MHHHRGASRAIDPGERSGVVAPANLARYAARWLEPDPAVSEVVDRYWSVRWTLDDGECISQRILTHPAVTLSVEEGEVPAPLVVTGVHRGAWSREIRRSGSVFAVRLRPAGLAVLSTLRPADVADSTLEVTRQRDPALHDLLAAVAGAGDDHARARRADSLIRHRLAHCPVDRTGRLANEAVTVLAEGGTALTGPRLADRLGCSERSVQRSLRATIGHGPKWVARWLRLQEVVRLLSQSPALALADVAHELGYTDQAHLTTDFRRAVGSTPGAYLASLRRLG